MKSPALFLALATTIGVLTVAITEPTLARGPKRVKADEGFALIQAALEDGVPKEVQWVIPTDAVIGRMRTLDEVGEWRARMVETLRGVKLTDTREVGDDAAARFVSRTGDAVLEVLLHYADDRWYVSGGTSYEVAGSALAATRGKKPARVELAARTQNKQWSGTAVSFAYATMDPDACKNRMNIFYCHNGDLHAVNGKITDLGKGKLDMNGGLPIGVEWKDKLPAQRGHAYAMWCTRRGTSDFYAGFNVKKLNEDKVIIDWTVLAAGLGSPTSIHEPMTVTTRDGADGSPGLCGKSGR